MSNGVPPTWPPPPPPPLDPLFEKFLKKLAGGRDLELVWDEAKQAWKWIPKPPPGPTPPPWWVYTGPGRPVLGIGAAGWTLIAAAAVAFAIWRISNELKEADTPPPPAPGGPPCGNSDLATVTFPAVTGWSFLGGTAAYKDAESKARAVCAANAALCSGNCSSGTCKPNLSVQDVEYGSYGLFSTVKMTFRCPCECY